MVKGKGLEMDLLVEGELDVQLPKAGENIMGLESSGEESSSMD